MGKRSLEPRWKYRMALHRCRTDQSSIHNYNVILGIESMAVPNRGHSPSMCLHLLHLVNFSRTSYIPSYEEGAFHFSSKIMIRPFYRLTMKSPNFDFRSLAINIHYINIILTLVSWSASSMVQWLESDLPCLQQLLQQPSPVG